MLALAVYSSAPSAGHLLATLTLGSDAELAKAIEGYEIFGPEAHEDVEMLIREAREARLELSVRSANLVRIVAIFIGVSGVVVAVNTYLQTSSPRPSSTEDKRSKTDIAKLNAGITAMAQFEHRIVQLEKSFDRHSSAKVDLSQDERSELVHQVRTSIENTAKGEYIKQLEKDLELRIEQRETAAEITSLFERTIERIGTELSSLAKRGNVNLALGIGMALIGILLLLYFVQDVQGQRGNLMRFVQDFVPRISLVLLVEVFAYFFLRLYSAGLVEIKYFQNELTNVEAMLISLQSAQRTGNQELIGEVIAVMSRTERNRVLNKGQTTVDIEQSKTEKSTIVSLAESLAKAVSNREDRR